MCGEMGGSRFTLALLADALFKYLEEGHETNITRLGG